MKVMKNSNDDDGEGAGGSGGGKFVGSVGTGHRRQLLQQQVSKMTKEVEECEDKCERASDYGSDSDPNKWNKQNFTHTVIINC